MTRQFMIFLADGDAEDLFARIEAVEHGVVVLPGKYVSTCDPSELLSQRTHERRANTMPLEFKQGARTEHHIILAHRTISKSIVLHKQVTGACAGFSGIDVRRSDVLELLLRPPRCGRLRPSQLSATVTFTDGFDKTKKNQDFGAWVGRVLRALENAYPRSSLSFIHVAPSAAVMAAGGGLLTYLEQPIEAAPCLASRQTQKERVPLRRID